MASASAKSMHGTRISGRRAKPLAGRIQRRAGLKAGITSSEIHWNCSNIVVFGVPIGLERVKSYIQG
jgi:hypothetical protein